MTSLIKGYIKRIFYSFCPRIILKCSPLRNRQKEHWKNQDFGGSHGYDHYNKPNEKRDALLIEEIKERAEKNTAILDLGCNCGRDLFSLKMMGYCHLTGVDICGSAIEYGKKQFDLSGIELIAGSYEEVLPKLVAANKQFDLIYSGGASISMVHPSFDVIQHICLLSKKYVLQLNEDNAGFAYPRLWEYEFNRCGFKLVKYLKPAYANNGTEDESNNESTLAIYRKI